MSESRYKATGIDRNGRRFCIKTSNRMYLMGLNLWRGIKWVFGADGKWHILCRIYN